MIDEAILTALIEKKPVYLEVPVNLNAQRIPIPSALSFVPPKKVRQYTTCSKHLLLQTKQEYSESITDYYPSYYSS